MSPEQIMNLRAMRVVYEKACNGDSIGDAELATAVEFFSDLETRLVALGPVFQLAASEAGRCYRMLDGFSRVRATW